MFEHVLIPVDGSEPASAAARFGMDLAAEHDATVHVLYVVEPVPMGEGGTGQVIESMQEAGESIVSETAEQAEERGLTVVTTVNTGTAKREILDYAERNDIDLVVIGTHGRTGIGRYLLGSVTESVVRLSDIPVLTVQSPADNRD